jgi:hypothetical protein
MQLETHLLQQVPTTRIGPIQYGPIPLQNLTHHATSNIGQAKWSPMMRIRQPLMVDPKQMQHRRMQVMDMNSILNSVIPKVICHSMSDPPLYATTSHPHRKPMVIMLATIPILRMRGPTKLSSPNHQRIVKQPSLLQVAQ